MELEASHGASPRSGVSHSHGPAASVVPHARASTGDKDSLCSSLLPLPLWGLPWVGIGWWAPHSPFVLGDTHLSFMLPAGGVGLAVPLSSGLVSSRFVPSTMPFPCPFTFRVKRLRGGRRLGEKTVVALMHLGKLQSPH